MNVTSANTDNMKALPTLAHFGVGDMWIRSKCIKRHIAAEVNFLAGMDFAPVKGMSFIRFSPVCVI